MWPFKKKETSGPKKETSEPERIEPEEDPLKWYPVGEGNPYLSPVLDLRSFTLGVTATTKDPAIATNYSASREDNGEQYIDSDPEGFTTIVTHIAYDHNGADLEGIVFKSSAMEEKWDIYAYGDWFYFVRSWTSDLVYKVKYQNTGESLIFSEIRTNAIDDNSEEVVPQNIHSMMMTHALGRVWPFHIPEAMREQSNREIAIYFFSQFGSKATLATNENVITLSLKNKQG